MYGYPGAATAHAWDVGSLPDCRSDARVTDGRLGSQHTGAAPPGLDVAHDALAEKGGCGTSGDVVALDHGRFR